MDRLKQELGKLKLPTTGIKNELQRGLMEQLQLQGIDIETYEFEDEEERELQAPATSSGIDINLQIQYKCIFILFPINQLIFETVLT